MILKVAPPSYRLVSILTTDLVLVAAAAMLVCAVTVGSWWADEVLRTLDTDAVERCPATDSMQQLHFMQQLICILQPQLRKHFLYFLPVYRRVRRGAELSDCLTMAYEDEIKSSSYQ